MTRDRLVSLVWGALGIAAMLYSWRLGIKGPYGPGAGLMPFIAGAIIVLANIPSIVARTAPTADAAESDEDNNYKAVWFTLALIVALIVAAPWLGFLISTTLCMLGLLQVLARPRWYVSLLFSVVACAAIVWLFTSLGVRLPQNVFGF